MAEKFQYTQLGPAKSHVRRRWARTVLERAVLGFILLWTTYNVVNYAFETSQFDHDPKQIILESLKINLAEEWSKKYTSEPHLAGTNYPLVEWTAAKFEEFGFKSVIDEYEVLLTYPKAQDLNVIESKSGKVVYTAPLKEDVLEEDKTTQGNDTIPTFLAYAANGNVTAEYVYVNYGSPEDFARLSELGVDVAGKVVIARLGRVFRGLKVKFAQDAGAVGVILYTDPGDDLGVTPANGYKQYPEGPARQESSVQRGSLQFLGGIGSTPGDPTTPGYPSKAGAERQDPHHCIPKIPALTVSYREVTPILERLNGHGANVKDKNWKGGLEGIDYSTGPNSKYTLNLYNEQSFNMTPIWNVYGEIEGENKDEVVILGNHRDAWIKGGAGDPNSGSATLLEVARALGSLKAAGYKFKRTIVLQSFDGEEYGIIGSTEQGEYFADKYKRNVVAYVNLDVAVVGKHLLVYASPTLNHVSRQAAKELEFPEKDVGTVYDDWVKQNGAEIGVLGSGSDFTVYLEHLGIPSVHFGFGPVASDFDGAVPVYQDHSNYDSFHWMQKYGDPGFVYHNLAAKYVSFVLLRLSEQQVIEFKLKEYARELSKYFGEVVEAVPKSWLHQKVEKEQVWQDYLQHDESDVKFIKDASSEWYYDMSPLPFMELLKERKCQRNKMHGAFTAKQHKDATVHELIGHTQRDLEQLHNTTAFFDAKSESLQFKYDNRSSLKFWQRIQLYFQVKNQNKLLQYFERSFLHDKGLHERSWFKHIVYASGRFTGYEAQTLPGLRESIEDGDVDRFVHWLGIVSKAIRRVNSSLVR